MPCFGQTHHALGTRHEPQPFRAIGYSGLSGRPGCPNFYIKTSAGNTRISPGNKFYNPRPRYRRDDTPSLQHELVPSKARSRSHRDTIGLTETRNRDLRAQNRYFGTISLEQETQNKFGMCIRNANTMPTMFVRNRFRQETCFRNTKNLWRQHKFLRNRCCHETNSRSAKICKHVSDKPVFTKHQHVANHVCEKPVSYEFRETPRFAKHVSDKPVSSRKVFTKHQHVAKPRF